jgi:hypothetical protein
MNLLISLVWKLIQVELEELHIYSQFGLESLSRLGNSIVLFDHMVECTFPVAVRWELSSTTATNGGSDTIFPSRSRTFPEQYEQNIIMYIAKYF